MTMMQDVLQSEGTAAVGVVQSREELGILKGPGRAAAIWQRPSSPDFQRWIETLNPKNLPSARLVLRPQNVMETLSELCTAAQTPKGEHRQHLINDISALAEVFCEFMSAPYVRLRLDLVTSNACRKFHIDALTARLVCTYRGTGTQYGLSADGAEPSQVFTVPTGAPILLRGTLWPEKPASGLLHRSPPIEGSGETRLVLVLDPIFDLEEER
ncbi:MAG: DUF1826 domain-containing protein [Roseobacter sp.]